MEVRHGRVRPRGDRPGGGDDPAPAAPAASQDSLCGDDYGAGLAAPPPYTREAETLLADVIKLIEGGKMAKAARRAAAEHASCDGGVRTLNFANDNDAGREAGK